MLERLPIRWKLALTSAVLTFVILCTFALVVGELTQRRIRADFVNSAAAEADELQARITVHAAPGQAPTVYPTSDLELLSGGSQHAAIRILTLDGYVIDQTARAPHFGGPPFATVSVQHGYRVETRQIRVVPLGYAILQYARPLSELDNTIDKVRLFLIFGVLGGTALALLAGVMLARRAMKPIAELTEATDEIRRTRDPGRRIVPPPADDEVAQLARTLDRMLQALDESQSETEAMLARQREFVADASHELRTPLTSVLANLELLADALDGDEGDVARSALRSSQRMRRLVADLLLLARADAQREAPRRAFELGQVVVEAAGELGALSADHEVSIDTSPVRVDGVRDDMHRVALNLMENALRHTPPGTHVRAVVRREGANALLIVEDDGPGIPADLRGKVFDRFVRGSGDRGGSFGLGLSIVRAVADQHGGSVTFEDAHPGTRFVVRVPALAAEAAPQRPVAAAR